MLLNVVARDNSKSELRRRQDVAFGMGWAAKNTYGFYDARYMLVAWAVPEHGGGSAKDTRQVIGRDFAQ